MDTHDFASVSDYSANSSGQILREKANINIHDFFIGLAKETGAKYDF